MTDGPYDYAREIADAPIVDRADTPGDDDRMTAAQYADATRRRGW